MRRRSMQSRDWLLWCAVGIVINITGLRARTTRSLYIFDAKRSVISQVANLTEDASLMIIDRGTIYKGTVSMAFDPGREVVYYYNPGLPSITRCRLANIKPCSYLRIGKGDYAGALAVDPVLNLIYFSDPDGFIAVMDTNWTRHFLTRIFDNQIRKPTAIALAATEGYVFWADAGLGANRSYIGRAYMDGTHAEIVVSNIVGGVGAVAFQGGRLYWSEGLTNAWHIRVSDANGTNRAEVYMSRDGHKCHTLAVDSEFIYWATADGIMCYKSHDPSTTPQCENITATQILASTPHEASRCQGLTLPTPRGRVCRCSDGYRLDTDGVSCRKLEFRRCLFFSVLTEIYAMDVDSMAHVMLPFSVYSRHPGLVYDPRSDSLIWVDKSQKTIEMAAFDDLMSEKLTGKIKPVYSSSNANTKWTGLALDVDRRSLYVFDAGDEGLVEISLLSKTQTNLVSRNLLSEPGVILVHPDTRQIFLAEHRNRDGTKITQVAADGTSRHLARKAITPGGDGLTIDSDGDIYWSDRNRTAPDQYRVVKLDPTLTTRQVVISSNTTPYNALAVGGDVLFYTLVGTRGIFVYNMSGGSHNKSSLPYTIHFLYYVDRGNTSLDPVDITKHYTRPHLALILGVGVGVGVVVLLTVVILIHRRRSTSGSSTVHDDYRAMTPSRPPSSPDPASPGGSGGRDVMTPSPPPSSPDPASPGGSGGRDVMKLRPLPSLPKQRPRPHARS